MRTQDSRAYAVLVVAALAQGAGIIPVWFLFVVFFWSAGVVFSDGKD